MKRFHLLLVVLLGGVLFVGLSGCSSDPNVEGAKLDLNNKDYDRALENISEALANNPDNAEAHYVKGQILQAQAFEVQDQAEHTTLFQEMIDAYNRAAELDPEMGETIQNRLTAAYIDEFQRGVQAFNRGQQADNGTADYEASAVYFANASTVRPDSIDAYMNRGYALINAQQSEQAIEPFQMAIDKGDTSIDTYSYLARLYDQYGQSDRAISLLEEARDMYPEDEDVQALLLNAYVSAGQTDRAMEVYREAVESNPDNQLYQYNYGSILLEAEDYDGAIEHLSRAIELDPTYTSAYYNLGAAYVNKAVSVNEQISALDDRRIEQQSSMSADELRALEAEMDQLAEERRELFTQAIPHLEQARSLAEAEGENTQGICAALFQAYAQTQQTEKAEAVSECAGYEDMN